MTAGPRHTHTAPCSEARAIRKDNPGLLLKTTDNPEGSRPAGSRSRRQKPHMNNQTRRVAATGGAEKHRIGRGPHLAIAA